MGVFREYSQFFRQFRETFHTTGAVLPSGRWLARALARHIAEKQGPARILEVGPGTGAVTRSIVPHLRDGDVFDLVELNPEFVRILNSAFENDPSFQPGREFATVHEVPIQEFQTDQPYDFVVSGLPLNNFSAEMVQTIFDAIFGLMHEQSTFSFFEYIYIRDMRRLVSRGDERERMRQLDEIGAQVFSDHGIACDWVWFNVPPAWARHCRPGANSSS